MDRAGLEALEAKERCVEELHNAKIESYVGQTLRMLYPGYRWYIEARIRTGICAIKNQTLGGEMGYVIPIAKLLNETDGPRLVMIAGGEILERHGLARGARTVRGDEIKRDSLGNAIGDLN